MVLNEILLYLDAILSAQALIFEFQWIDLFGHGKACHSNGSCVGSDGSACP